MKEYMIIDGIKAEINGEKNVLEVARKAGIEIPFQQMDVNIKK